MTLPDIPEIPQIGVNEHLKTRFYTADLVVTMLWPHYDLMWPLDHFIRIEYFARKFLFVLKIILVKITRITTGKFFFRSRTVSNPFHDGTFCEHPRPWQVIVPHFIKARSFWSESLSWPMTSAEPNHSTWQIGYLLDDSLIWLILMMSQTG